MNINHNTTLYLLTNIDIDDENEIDFDSVEAQYNYFYDKRVLTLVNSNENTDFKYIRDNDSIAVAYYIDELVDVNFVMYENDNKWFYAKITKKEYVNPKLTRLYLKIDVFQTFMFDYEFEESFVEREHQDRFDENLKPIYNIELENLDCGNEYDIVEFEKLKDNANAPDNLAWCEILTTQPITKLNDTRYQYTNPSTYIYKSLGLSQKGVFTGVYVYLMPVIVGENLNSGIFYTKLATGNIVTLSNLLIFASTSSAIISARIINYCPIKYNIENYQNGFLITFPSGYAENPTTDKTEIRVAVGANTNFGGVDMSFAGGNYFLNLSDITENENYTLNKQISNNIIPNLDINSEKNKNNETKLYTYPYQYQQICDYQSPPLVIRNENLKQPLDICFKQSHGIQNKSKYFIKNYNNDNGKEYNTINSTINELPLLNNAYLNYMSSNKASATTGVALNIASGVATLGVGIATGGVGLAVAGTQALGMATQIASNLIKMQDLKNTPDSIRQAGNNAEFDIIDGNYGIVLSKFRIKNQYYNILFNYFTHYGYKCNDFKKPNIRSRYYFNYIKTIGANIKSNIANDFIDEIKAIFNNGVTIWHYRDAETFKGVKCFDYENAEINLITEEA